MLRFMSHLMYASFASRISPDIRSNRYSCTADSPMSSTHWLRLVTFSRPGMCRHQSGCCSIRQLIGLTISGSNHKPNWSPRARNLAPNPASPSGSFCRFTNQSPRLVVSSLRSPNQPSSRTSISMPTSFASRAKASSLSSSKSKYVASQLFTRIGQRSVRYLPRTRCCIWNPFSRLDSASNP